MPSIFCHDRSTDQFLIDQFLSGYVVCIDGTDYKVIGSGSNKHGQLTIEAHAWDGDKDEPITAKVFELVYDDIDTIEVY